MQKMQYLKVVHGGTCVYWQPMASYHSLKKLVKPKTKIYILFKF